MVSEPDDLLALQELKRDDITDMICYPDKLLFIVCRRGAGREVRWPDPLPCVTLPRRASCGRWNRRAQAPSQAHRVRVSQHFLAVRMHESHQTFPNRSGVLYLQQAC